LIKIKSVLTLTEAYRQQASNFVDAISHKVNESTKPIYGANCKGNPEHIGSCIFINIAGIKILLTAAHVIDWKRETILYVGGEQELVPIVGNFYSTCKKDGDRNKDKYDFAWLVLNDLQIISLKGISFIDEKSIGNIRDYKKGLYLAFGYPNSKNKKANLIRMSVKQIPFTYSSILIRDAQIYKKLGLNPRLHILLDFNKFSQSENGQKQISVKPVGISGGGLFFIADMGDLKSYSDSANPKGDLVGLITEHNKDCNVIISTNMDLILKSIRKKIEETASAVMAPADKTGKKIN
jgi:hypothetical protein